jgi:hypothetical protein
MKFTAFVKSELQRLGFRFREDRKNFVMPCIRGHDNKTWSLGIRKRDGVCHCFGCGNSWSWNRFAEEVNAAQIDPNSEVVFDDPYAIVAEELDEIAKKGQGTKEPYPLEPWHGEWRGFSDEFLKSVPTYLWWDTHSWDFGGHVHRAYWKVTIWGEVKGYVSRRLDGEKMVKYRNAAGMSSLTVLFPFDFCPAAKCLVLVEGPVDALRLISHGVPALAVLGTNNWTFETSSLLVAKGATHPIICGDGDDAGRKFNNTVYEQLKDYFDASVYPLPDGEDPGGMSVEMVEELKAITDSWNGAA